MALETGTYISDLVATNPTSSDLKNSGDDHLRLLKSTIKATFPNVSNAVTPTHTELNYVDGVTSAIQTQIDSKAAHAGQVYTGTHAFAGATAITVPTKSASDNTTAAASTAYVDAADALKANIASPTFTGTATLPASTSIGNVSATELGYLDGVTSAVQTQFDAKAPLASPTFTGTPAAPTATAGTATTQIATTAFVASTSFSSALPSQTGNSGKYVTTNGSVASWVALTGLPSQTGSAGKYLTTDATNASWAALTAPALVLLATVTPTVAANVDFLSTFSSTYDDYLIIGNGITLAADDVVRIRVSVAGTADSGSNYYEGGSYGGGTITAATAFVSVTGTTTTAGKGAGFEIRVMNANATTGIKMMWINSAHQTNATPGYASRLTISTYAASNAISGVRFYCSGGSNFGASGQIRVYGISKT